MYVRLNDEQRLLVDTVDAIGRALATTTVAQIEPLRFDAVAWRTLADTGLLGVHLPEGCGGGGATALEAALVVEGLARHLVATPVLGAMLAASAMAGAGRDRDTASIVHGGEPVALGLSGDLRGPGEHVAFDAVGADRAAVVTAAGVSLAPLGSDLRRPADITRRYAELRPAAHGGATPLGEAAADRWLALALVLVCADSVGVAAAALEEAVSYAKQREQFGVAVGTFQAVQHLAADAHVELEAMRSVVIHAAWSATHRDAAGALIVARHAKALVAECAHTIGETAIQILGGIGMTWEHLAHVRLRRLLANRVLLGDEHEQHRALAAHPLVESPDGLAVPQELDFRDTPDEAEFRAQLRRWLGDNLPGPLPTARDAWAEAMHSWHRALGRAGYMGLSFPVDVGGRGLPDTYEAILNDELGRSGAPPALAISHMTNAIRLFGTDEQRRAHLLSMLTAETRWCQGFSEPNAGSDLAAISTRATLDGDDYVITGQKIWTSDAVWADWCLLLCRTEDAPRHRGLSILLVPMDTAGIDCRPIVTAFRTDEFAEVFFDGARVPVANRLGAPGQGWAIAMALLAYERGPADMGWVGRMGRTLHALARETEGAPPEIRSRVVRAGSWLHALECKVRRTLSDRVAGAAGDADGSVDKLLMTQVDQLIHSLWLDLHGAGALLDDGDEVSRYLWARAAGIFGGTRQIQRNIVAQRVLGLPRA